MPTETKSRRAVLSAIERVDAISELASKRGDHYAFELDLEVSVYGRNYNGKRVGPYIKLLTFQPEEEIVREGDGGATVSMFWLTAELTSSSTRPRVRRR
jgi:hypothetical protein